MISLLTLSALLLCAPHEHDHESDAPVGQATIVVFNPSEGAVQVEERWSLQLKKATPVGALALPVPEGAEDPQTDPEDERFSLQGGELVNAKALPAGIVEPLLRYKRTTEGGRLAISRITPFDLMAARLVILDLPGLKADSVPMAEPQKQRFSEQRYQVFNLPGMRAGAHMDLLAEGLPEPRPWPARLAIAGMLFVWLWFFFALSRPARAPNQQRALSPAARKARLLAALDRLEADKADIPPRRYARRQRALIEALAALLKAEAAADGT